MIPDPGDDVIRRRLLAAMNSIAKAGLTEIHDAGEPGKTLPAKVLRVLETLAESGSMPIRVYHMLSGDADPAWLEEQLRIGPRKSGRDDRLRVRAVKLYLDGALGSRGAALLEDYSDDPKNRGLLLTDPAEFRKRAEAATRAGFQVAVHAIGDRGNRLALDTYEALRPLAGADPRFRIEHAQIVDPGDIPRFAKIGVMASMQPTHATSDMPWAPARLGGSDSPGPTRGRAS